MIRIILFLLLIALGAAGAAWIAEQTGDVVLSWGGWRAQTTLPVFVLALGITVVAAMMMWAILRILWRTPERLRRSRRERRQARGRHAITQGLLAIGHGDSTAARIHAETARKHAAQDPLALLLHAQSAQLDGDREGAQRAFRAMAEREDTRLLGLRGLFIEAQRADDPVAAVMVAEEALKLSPSSSWASHAVLGFCCAKGDWAGALKILDNNQSAGLIDKATYRRQRGVLLTARALEFEKVDRDLSRDQRDGSNQAGADAGAGRGAREQIRKRGASGAAFDAHRRDGMAGAAASRSRGRLCACEARRFRAPAAGAGADAGRQGAGAHRGRAGDRARRDRRVRIYHGARGAGAVHRSAYAAGRHADGGDRAHRAWRFRPRAGVDLARGARAARSGLDRGWLCQRSLAAGIAGQRAAGCLPMADAGRSPAVRQRRCDRILAVRGSHAGGPAQSGRARAAGPGRGGAGPVARRRPAPSAAPAVAVTPAVAAPAPAAEQDNAPPPAAAVEAAPAEAAPMEAASAAAAAPSPVPAEPAPSRPAPLFRARQDIPKAVPARFRR